LKRGNKPGSLPKIIKQSKKLQDLNIIEFATDPNYLNLSFKERPAQEVILRSIYGLPLDKEQLKIYRKLTTNKKEFEAGESKLETILNLGARSGKSLIASIIGIYEATRNKWQKYLRPGESGYVVIIATRQKQAEAIIGKNCLSLMENSYHLKKMIKDSTQSELTLTNGMKIISLPCNSTAGRGLPIFCLVYDEIGHFFTEGVKADENIFNALRPRQVQFPGAKLVLISTPSAKQGVFWQYFQEGFQIPGRFVAHASSLFMNPLINKAFLEREKNRDIDNYNREYEAIFAEKVESFLGYEIIQNSLNLAGDLPYRPEFSYEAGIHASGLSGNDKFALAVGHKENNKVKIDKAISWDLKDPEPIMKDIEELKNAYHFNKVSIDRYAKGWVQASIEKIGLEVEIRPPLAEIYVNLKSLMIAGNIDLPDNQEIKKGMQNTLAFYGKNNSLSIAHERTKEGHSDLCDAIATTAFTLAKEQPIPQIFTISSHRPRPWTDFDDDDLIPIRNDRL
jgi:hypothetical protein